jgi:hypothetical protein
MSLITRWKYLILSAWHSGDELNRRVKVEQHLFDCANGKKPLPDVAKCRELALFLGTPSWAVKK